MIADQTTQTRTQRTAAASLMAFLDEYPQFDAEPIHFDVRPGGYLWVSVSYLSPETGRLVSELAQALHATVAESPTKAGKDDVRMLQCEAIFDGTRWVVAGFLPLDTLARETAAA